MLRILKSDRLTPPKLNDPWLAELGQAFDAERIERISRYGKLLFAGEDNIRALDTVFVWGHPERFIRTMFMENCGCALTVWEGARKKARRPILEQRSFTLPVNSELVLSTFERCAKAASEFNDWVRYPLLAREIMLNWKGIADEW